MDHPFKQPEWDAQQWDGLDSSRVVLGIVRLRGGAMTVALRQILGILHLSKQVDIYWHSHSVAASPACRRNSGWISSGPGALPVFIDLSVSTSSSVVNGVDMFTSLLSTFHSSATSFPTCLEKSRPGLVKQPFWSCCDAIAFTHGTLVWFRCGSTCEAVDSVPSFSAGVCEVNRFHCLYPTFLAFFILALDLDVSCGFRPLTGCCGCVVFIQLLAFFVPAWNVVLLIATGNWLPGCIG